MEYEEHFRQAGAEFSVDWRLLAAIAERESKLDPQAVGSAGEKGLMQIYPSTWSEWAPKVGVSDPFDPASNVRVAAAYLSWIVRVLADVDRRELYWSMAAYNWGIGNTLRLLNRRGKWTDVPRVTREYATQVVLAADTRVISQHLIKAV